MMANDRPRELLASIHDVSPRFESEIDHLLDSLRPYVGSTLALLVVPNHWGDAPIRARSPFASRLRGWADEGMEIFLHGYFHRDDSRHGGARDRIRANLLTANEGEFLGLSRREAARRIADGRAVIEDVVGRAIDGFVAPAWLYGPGARKALREAAIPIAEDHFRIWSPASGEDLARGPVITWASRTRTRLVSSLAAAAALRRLPVRVTRIGVHPPDAGKPELLRSIGRTFEAAARARTAARYSDLLNKTVRT
jgi:predicted deacetylase